MTITADLENDKTFYLAEQKELNWLVALVLTDKFALKNSVVSWDIFDEETVEDWIEANAEAKKLLSKAKAEFIKESENGIQPDTIMVDSYDFLKWAEQQGYAMSQVIYNAVKQMLTIQKYTEDAIRTENFQFPRLEIPEFEMLLKEPLWSLTRAILYVNGIKTNQRKARIISYIKAKPEFMKLCDYIASARRIKKLDYILSRREEDDESLSAHQDFYEISVAEVEPQKFIDWVMTLPLQFPILQKADDMAVKEQVSAKPVYVTPLMRLMYAAIDNFWSEYNLSKPNRHIAPKKDEVVTWLMEESKRQDVKLSESLAERIDTIIRCPATKGGGNTY